MNSKEKVTRNLSVQKARCTYMRPFYTLKLTFLFLLRPLARRSLARPSDPSARRLPSGNLLKLIP